MRRTTTAWCVLIIELLCTIRVAQAQDNEAPTRTESATAGSQDAKSTVGHQRKSVVPYRLDFSFDELESGKKINTRHYSITLTAGSADEVKIGTRVPIGAGIENPTPSQIQYLDVGTNIWAMLRNDSDDLQLEVRAESSWTKHEDVDPYPRAPHTTFTPPIVSQIKINGSTLLLIGKPMVIGIVDDPYSTRQFELEVTATKLK